MAYKSIELVNSLDIDGLDCCWRQYEISYSDDDSRKKEITYMIDKQTNQVILTESLFQEAKDYSTKDLEIKIFVHNKRDSDELEYIGYYKDKTIASGKKTLFFKNNFEPQQFELVKNSINCIITKNISVDNMNYTFSIGSDNIFAYATLKPVLYNMTLDALIPLPSVNYAYISNGGTSLDNKSRFIFYQFKCSNITLKYGTDSQRPTQINSFHALRFNELVNNVFKSNVLDYICSFINNVKIASPALDGPSVPIFAIKEIDTWTPSTNHYYLIKNSIGKIQCRESFMEFKAPDTIGKTVIVPDNGLSSPNYNTTRVSLYGFENDFTPIYANSYAKLKAGSRYLMILGSVSKIGSGTSIGNLVESYARFVEDSACVYSSSNVKKNYASGPQLFDYRPFKLIRTSGSSNSECLYLFAYDNFIYRPTASGTPLQYDIDDDFYVVSKSSSTPAYPLSYYRNTNVNMYCYGGNNNIRIFYENTSKYDDLDASTLILETY